MPEIEIRPLIASDIAILTGINLSYTSTHVWQMERISEEGIAGAHFREVRLPREARVEYPRPASQIFEEPQNPGQLILAAVIAGRPIGYVHISTLVAPRTAWVKDWAVQDVFRRKGVGAALLLASLEWSLEENCRRIVVEMQSKNYPAIKLVRKLGFEYAGYHDQYYFNQDIAVFFARSLR